MPAQNQPLRELQASLVKQNNKLNKSLDGVTDPAIAWLIVMEMQEISHRITLTGQLLFAKNTAELRARVEAAKKATAKLNKAVQTIQNIAQVLDASTDLLTLVDDAIDLAKSLA